MWYDLYHVSNFTRNCMYRPYMYRKWWSWTNGFVLVLIQVELIQIECSKHIRSILAYMWVTTYKFVWGKSIILIHISLASSCVSSRLPPNKVPSLMLRIHTCELPHTNLYVVNQSYEFVFHLTSSLQPPNKKVRTFGKWCWWRSPNKAPSLMLQNDTCGLPHTNLYVYHQSYGFVLRNTKNISRQNQKN